MENYGSKRVWQREREGDECDWNSHASAKVGVPYIHGVTHPHSKILQIWAAQPRRHQPRVNVEHVKHG